MEYWRTLLSKFIALALMVVLTAQLTACKHGIKIHVEKHSEVVFHLSKYSAFSFGNHCITSLSVYEEGDNHALWDIQSTDRTCKTIQAIHYGSLPEGFSELEKPRTLNPGRKYTVDVEGYAWSGVTQFKLP